MFPDANDVTVYGEGYGAKIQSGGMYRQDQAVIVFDVRVGPWWLSDENVADVAGGARPRCGANSRRVQPEASVATNIDIQDTGPTSRNTLR